MAWFYKVSDRKLAEIVKGQAPQFKFYDGWIPGPSADSYYQRCTNEIPWRQEYWNMVIKLPQLAYYYDPKERKKRPNPVLEELIGYVEQEFNTTVTFVWCNLFKDGKHHIDWHQDKYGEHLCVLSFGSSRKVVFRPLGTKQGHEHLCKHGDLYTFNPAYDAAHEHCVPTDE
eukprot:CAMPEP_0174362374 /NCGR_PEP_ID=MMETSP0811_2-20130205/64063_1 /TAXON_ID=73025 ORGANISM="Eutreptiella gymnastica-like, Strain CCMP1594" /NCGR_SAMPLE_ID=MMETSP0811_2 /ASSEMBLY_ACC=CAM_ASM_000667 /LENGTH=170 /DNA_ID=CAMNT_0015499991 /DNA_START=21 /DNA_END=530 /DNA_ORIENTATION=+